MSILSKFWFKIYVVALVQMFSTIEITSETALQVTTSIYNNTFRPVELNQINFDFKLFT